MAIDTTSSGILVPGGFGARGTEGMIYAIKYAREVSLEEELPLSPMFTVRSKRYRF